MSIWSTLFSGSDTANKVTDAIIDTGDALFHTSEEKAEDRRKQREFFPTLLSAFEPFKIAQRVLAIWFSGLFGLAFIMGLLVYVFNSIATYKQSVANVTREIPLEIVTIPIEPLLDLIVAFNIGTIVALVVAWYFSGGVIDSFKRRNY